MLLYNSPFINVLVFRELITATQIHCKKGSLTTPAAFPNNNAFSLSFFHSTPSEIASLFSSLGSLPFIVLGKSVLASNIT